MPGVSSSDTDAPSWINGKSAPQSVSVVILLSFCDQPLNKIMQVWSRKRVGFLSVDNMLWHVYKLARWKTLFSISLMQLTVIHLLTCFWTFLLRNLTSGQRTRICYLSMCTCSYVCNWDPLVLIWHISLMHDTDSANMSFSCSSRTFLGILGLDQTHFNSLDGQDNDILCRQNNLKAKTKCRQKNAISPTKWETIPESCIT